MTRFSYLVFCALAGLGLAACGGGGGGDVTDVVPRAKAVSGWTIDPDNAYTADVAAAIAVDKDSAEDLIDGAAADFFAAPNVPLKLAWQNYVNTSLIEGTAMLSLFVFQMASENDAAGKFAAIKGANLYKGEDWVEPSAPVVGTASRIADTGSNWWINFHKGVYYVEVNVSPSYNPAPPYTPEYAVTKDAAFTFAQALASKM